MSCGLARLDGSGTSATVKGMDTMKPAVNLHAIPADKWSGAFLHDAGPGDYIGLGEAVKRRVYGEATARLGIYAPQFDGALKGGVQRDAACALDWIAVHVTDAMFAEARNGRLWATLEDLAKTIDALTVSDPIPAWVFARKSSSPAGRTPGGSERPLVGSPTR